MPTKNTVSKTTKTQIDVGDSIKDQLLNYEKENHDLKNQVLEMKEQIAQLISHITSKESTEDNIENEKTIVNTSAQEENYEEPSANKQIKIMSMYYGTLNLCTSENRTSGKTLTFNKYGQIKSVMYKDLVDYVNNNRKFAENGYFYILDKAAVYHVGLSNEYTRLVDSSIVNNITNYTKSDIEQITSMLTDAQKNLIAKVLSDKIANKKEVDRNKVALISDLIGIDIQKKANEQMAFFDTHK